MELITPNHPDIKGNKRPSDSPALIIGEDRIIFSSAAKRLILLEPGDKITFNIDLSRLYFYRGCDGFEVKKSGGDDRRAIFSQALIALLKKKYPTLKRQMYKLRATNSKIANEVIYEVLLFSGTKK